MLRAQKVSAVTGVIVLLLGLGVTASLSLGGSWSTRLYLVIAQNASFELGNVLSEVALLTLVAAWAVTASVLMLRRSLLRLSVLISGGAGAIVAYACSELLKLLFTNTRPCVTYEAIMVASCPPAENWSYPSNHTVIACALTVSLVMALPRLGLMAVPTALLAAVARVLSGHHYPHDVLGGAALGTSIAIAVVLFVAPPVLRRLQRSRITGIGVSDRSS